MTDLEMIQSEKDAADQDRLVLKQEIKQLNQAYEAQKDDYEQRLKELSEEYEKCAK